jgi:hypothetical protein
MTAKQLREEIERLYSTVDPDKCQDDKKIIRRETVREQARQRAKASNSVSNMRAAWDALPEEEKQRIYDRQAEVYANMSDKERNKFSKMVRDGIADMSDDAKDEMRRRWLESVASRSPERSAEIGKKIALSFSNMSSKQRAAHAEKSARHGADNGMYGKGELVKGERNGFYGKTHKDEVKKYLSDKAKNRAKNITCEHCGKVVDAQTYGTHHGKYCKKNPDRVMRNTTLGKKMPQSVEVCPHCEMSGGAGMMRRFHGDKCFMNGYYIQSYVDGKKSKLYKTHKSIVDDGHLFDRVKKVCLGKKPTYNGIVFVSVKKK